MRPVVGPLVVLTMASSVSDAAAAPSHPPAAFLPLRSLFGGRRRPQADAAAPAPAAITTRAAVIPPDLVEPLREAPWRTGLEPAEDCALLEAPTVEVWPAGGMARGIPTIDD